MTNKPLKLILVAVIGLLALAACGSDSEDVPSLATKDTQGVKPTATALDDEARVMAFVQCMRDQGVEYEDPVVDSQGNVQRPELAEGFTITREELAAPYEACAHHLQGLTIGRERQDLSQRLDEFVELAACLRDKGYDLDDPTAETLDVWLTDFRVEFDWDDPKARAAYEECSGAE